MQPVFYSEIEPFPNRVLAARWPQVPNLGDLTKIDGTWWRGLVDVLWASFPCQDYSEAGKRAGMAGNNGVLSLAGMRLVDEIDPKVFCYENVKGLLSDDDNAFGHILARLSGEQGPLEPPRAGWSHAGVVLGPRRTVAWRVLDAQYFGVPQQRQRVIVVACPRTSQISPVALLHDSGAQGDSLAERQARRQDTLVGPQSGAVARRVAIRGREINGFRGQQIELGDDVANCLRTAGGGSSVGMVLAPRSAGYGLWDLRRLMPVECERLQGMPDNHTLIEGASDNERYDAIGNSLAVPMVRWLGERIVEALQ